MNRSAADGLRDLYNAPREPRCPNCHGLLLPVTSRSFICDRDCDFGLIDVDDVIHWPIIP